MTRATLPQRRPHEVFDFHHWGRKFIAGIGRARPQGPVREVWINTGRSGEQMETLARDSAVILSIALQYDVPLHVLRKAIMRDLDGQASGPIGALIDLLADDESGLGISDVPRQPTDPQSESREPVHAD